MGNLSYSLDLVDGTGIIVRVAARETPSFRPVVGNRDCPEELTELMERCWSDNPDERPTFEMIRSIIRCIRKWVYSLHPSCYFIQIHRVVLHTCTMYGFYLDGNWFLPWQKTDYCNWGCTWVSTVLLSRCCDTMVLSFNFWHLQPLDII